MARFDYRAYDAQGVLQAGSLEVGSREAALNALAQRGQHAVDVAEAAGRPVERWWQREVFGARGLSDTERLAFTRELAALLKADLPVDEALGIVLLQPGLSQRVKAVTARLHEDVRAGQSLSRALGAEAVSFPEYYWRLVAAGETGGALGDVMGDLGTYLERAAEVRGRISAALAYPMLLLAAAIAAVLVIMLVLIPAVMPLFADAGVAPPLVLATLAAIESFARGYWVQILFAAALLGIAALVFAKEEGVRRLGDRVALKVPVMGGIIATRETARLSRILAAQMKNGVPLLDALGGIAAVMGNSVYRDAVSTVSAGVAEGSPLSREMAATGLFSELAVRLAGVGERTGQLETMLTRAAGIHEAALQRSIDRLTRMLGPALTVVVGLFAGGLILSVMQAILSINDLALR
ncbi:MAG: type II secretion system F family protein [Hyphomicrobium sp.]